MFRLTSIWRSGISIVSHGGRISLPSVSMSDGHHVRPLSRHEGRPGETATQDTFGTLSDSLIQQHEQIREAVDADLDDDDGEAEFRAKISDTMRPRPGFFIGRIQDFLGKKDLKSALAVLDEEMRKEYVQPKEGHFRLLIHACGRAGYHAKAFKLFQSYKSRGFRPNNGIYSDLFNACANSPLPEQALASATGFFRKLKSENVQLPGVVYHNMIKAFGRCGDLKTAFSLVDEMKAEKLPINEETYCHLLQGCISDKKAGFRHALLTWRNMMRKKVTPNLYAYHLLLRATKECDMGDESFAYDILLACMNVDEARKHGLKLLESKKVKKPSTEGQSFTSASSTDNITTAMTSTGLQLVDTKSSLDLTETDTTALPNLLEKKPDFSNVISITSLSRPQDRFQLLGGVQGFCSAMAREKLEPDAKAFTYMLDLIPDDELSEASLIASMDKWRVTPDATLLNMLIRKRAHRGDDELARDTLSLFHKFQVSADLITYGCLALACKSRSESVSLVSEMKRNGFRPGVEIMTPMLNAAAKKLNVRLVLDLLRIIDREEIIPDKRLLQQVERFRKVFRLKVLENEKREKSEEHVRMPKALKMEISEGFKNWEAFEEYYQKWLQRTALEEEQHPWKQYLTKRDGQLNERNI